MTLRLPYCHDCRSCPQRHKRRGMARRDPAELCTPKVREARRSPVVLAAPKKAETLERILPASSIFDPATLDRHQGIMRAFLLAAVLWHGGQAAYTTPAPSLGSAGHFAVLGGSALTNTVSGSVGASLERHSRGQSVDSRTFIIPANRHIQTATFCVGLAGLQQGRRRHGLLARHPRPDISEEGMGGRACGAFSRGRPCRLQGALLRGVDFGSSATTGESVAWGLSSLAPSAGVGASEMGRAP